MTAQEAVRCIMKTNGITQTDVAEKIGKSQNGVAMFLKSGTSMRIDNLLKLLDVCGYDLIVVDRNGAAPSYRISNEEGLDVVGSERTSVAPTTPDYKELIREVVADELRKRGIE